MPRAARWSGAPIANRQKAVPGGRLKATLFRDRHRMYLAKIAPSALADQEGILGLRHRFAFSHVHLRQHVTTQNEEQDQA